MKKGRYSTASQMATSPLAFNTGETPVNMYIMDKGTINSIEETIKK
ncbi:hypothetical protein ACFLU1_07245 [Chloroflexota bacterium]